MLFRSVVTPSVANFILVHFPNESGRDADAANTFLQSRGVIVRKMGAYSLPGALRITIGREAENRAVVEAVGAFMSGTGR